MNTCWYCGIKLDMNNHSWDHQVPLARRGSGSGSNLVRACRRCNGEKGAMDVEEYRRWLESRALWGIEFYHERYGRPPSVEQIRTENKPTGAMLAALLKAGISIERERTA